MREYLEQIERVVAQGPYSDDWESLSKIEQPRWFNRMKFGIFIHWGVYSVPAFDNEWYPRNMYIQGSRAYEHHVATYGPHKDFGYKDFIPMFKAERFDPQAWAQLFADTGQKRPDLLVPFVQAEFGLIGTQVAFRTLDQIVSSLTGDAQLIRDFGKGQIVVIIHIQCGLALWREYIAVKVKQYGDTKIFFKHRQILV